jgi:hypothetical protein
MDINGIKEKLIRLFADHAVEDIEKDGSKLLISIVGNDQYRKLTDDLEFIDWLENLKELRDDLDQVLEGVESLRQVKACLKWLHDKKEISEMNDDKEYFLLGVKLLKKRIYTKWNEEQCSYFDRGLEMLVEWKDFFLSYTNRKFHETNNQFEELLSRVLDANIYKDNINKSNCVGQLLFHYLDLHGLTCFFDQRNLTCGDILKEEIFKHCTSVYAFVQLVGLSTLYYEDGSINWCYQEFKRFDEWVVKTGTRQSGRFQFVLTSEKKEVFPQRLHPSYKDWKKRIDEHIFIENLGEMSCKKLRIKMVELAKAIIKTRDRMLEAYYS